PPPRILRSTDGVNFEPLPQEPGTVLGDVTASSFTRLTVHDDRLYVVAGTTVGRGHVLMAEEPAGGNDNFSYVTPQNLRVFEMASFNDHLYLTAELELADPDAGSSDPVLYVLVKVDTSNGPPYTFLPVLREDGYLDRETQQDVLSLQEYRGKLYVGTDSSTELYRFDQDDEWDLIVGEARNTPDGEKEPLSDFGAGFDWPFNIHMWRMVEHDGALYVGTADMSQQNRFMPGVWQYRHLFGFDLYATDDGMTFERITINGLGDPFQFGARTFASTSDGLYVGSMSLWRPLRIWRTQSSCCNP
ncbi:MAG: hypothetical protein ACRDIB_09720, partial [Ardenticatenaceae bacterium]